MKLIVKKFSQRDSKWSAEKLGTSGVTIGSYGCALTCMAMLECYYGFDTDPLQLNQLFIDKGVYANRNLIGWYNIQNVNEYVKLTDWIHCEATPAPLKKIDEELNVGRPVICDVDTNPMEPGEQMHFVVITGKTDDGHYIINDPWTGEEYFFDAKYGEPAKGIFGMRLISGPVPKPPVTQPNVSELQGQVEQWKTYADDVKEHLRPAGVMPGDELPIVIGAIDKLVDIKNKYEELLKEKEDVIAPEIDEKIIKQFDFLGMIVRLIKKEKG